MRILIAAWRDLANDLAGGSEVLIDHLGAGLTERGHEVTLLCANPIGTGHAYEVHPNGGTVSQYVRAPFAYLNKHRDVDLVVDVANGVSFYTPFWRRNASLCLVNHIHTDQWDQWFNRPVAAIGRALELKGMPAAYRNRLFVAVSPSTADILAEMGVDRDRIRIIINGTYLPDSPGAEGPEPLFVGLGRLVPHKRFDLAIKAFNEIYPKVGGRLVIAGDGPERDRLRELAGPGVEVPGRISEAEKEDLLRKAWLMVHPASHEGWGLVITEAAAYGAPSLAFRVPGLQDSVVDGMSGVLIDDEAELAPTWLRIAQDAELRQTLRAGARRRAAACSWDATVDRFEEICAEAIEGHRRSLRLPRGSWRGPDEGVTVHEYHDHAADVDDRPELAGIPVGTGRPRMRVVRDRPDVTIVLPAFNEAARLPVSLPILTEHLATMSGRTEVIIVDDGSSDDTVRVASDLLKGVPQAGVLTLGKHEGKGAAVRAGVARATGHQIVFMDADMATDLEYLDPLLGALDEVPIAIGSRSAPGAITSGMTPSSDAAHRLFNVLGRRVTGLEVTDFQCGFKGFRAASGRLLFHLIRERGYAFDVEVVALAHRLGLEIREVPVHWRAVRGSHVRIVVDSVHMAYQTAWLANPRRHHQALSALTVRASDSGIDDETIATWLGDNLPISSPLVPDEHGTLALLPFVNPADAADLCRSLAEKLPDLELDVTSIDTRDLLERRDNSFRSAIADC